MAETEHASYLLLAQPGEVNPLILTTNGRVVAPDGKVNLYDNAAFRQTTRFGGEYGVKHLVLRQARGPG